MDKYGYNGELHRVITPDGYVLELHRITGRTNSSVTEKPVALVMPGLLASSAVWVLAGPNKGLGKEEKKKHITAQYIRIKYRQKIVPYKIDLS